MYVDDLVMFLNPA
jgi:hypothetical protein